jgi:membrane protease subunit HflK
MSWNNNGPWGPSGNKPSGNPWNTKGSPPGGSPPGSGMEPPDFDALLHKLLESFRRWHSAHREPPQIFLSAIAILLGLWLLSGFYQVSTDELGVVMRFGAFHRIEQPGLRYHAPYPIEDVFLPNVTAQNEIQIGFRSNSRDPDAAHSVPEESMMLTQDQNVIDVEFAVFWRIGDIEKFLFNIRDPQQTIKMAAESEMREVIGQNKLQYALTDGRGQIAEDARQRLQKLMDSYDSGVIISRINLQTVAVPDEVKAAFQDVVNAHLDQERFQNEAETHANKVIPEAKGQAAKIIQQAMAYRDQKIALAEGDADRFKEVLAAYNRSRDVTSKRLYLETVEAVLGNARKIILDKSGGGAVPYLPLQDLLNARPPEAAAK